MTRSFGWSALIHLTLLMAVLLLLLGQRPHNAPPTEASTVVVRPMKVAEPPERPELVAGDSSQASEPEPEPESEPEPAEPEPEHLQWDEGQFLGTWLQFAVHH